MKFLSNIPLIFEDLVRKISGLVCAHVFIHVAQARHLFFYQIFKSLRYKCYFVTICCASVLLVGCNTITRSGNPETIGKLKQFNRVEVKGGDFWITTYQKITDKNAPYVFYIEGDGAAFEGKYRVSHNPTPRRQMFLNLAAMDQRPNVVYVARPCQYTQKDLNPKCSPLYWTDRRMSDDSVESLNQVINSINRNGPFSLVGYSGGGGIAVLIAARNNMVKDILTIAANLDHAAFTSYHNVTPMVGSLNPVNYAAKVKNVPQLHISGAQDKIIPPFIADKFVAASGSPCVKQRIIPKIDHKHGWDKIWEYVLTIPLRCYD
jgi:dienelactone hydrolase